MVREHRDVLEEVRLLLIIPGHNLNGISVLVAHRLPRGIGCWPKECVRAVSVPKAFLTWEPTTWTAPSGCDLC